MTEQIYSEATRKININRKQIEDSLGVKMEVKNKIVFISGDADKEFICLQVIEAINLGFSVQKALSLQDEEFIFQKIPIKPIANRKDLTQVRGRVIGTQRKALDTIESLTDTNVVLHKSIIGVIGRREDVEKAVYVLKRIVAGSKHANMYAWLEKKKAEERFGL
jgi:ribosomal RNA assembly protein